jgi:membrane fusion protein (multidrug efflux system)
MTSPYGSTSRTWCRHWGIATPVGGSASARRVVQSALASAVLLVAAGCKKDPGKDGAPPPPPPPAVTVTQAIRKTVPIFGDFVARTAADEEVELRARVEGFLEKVNFDTGDPVNAGDVVFEIEKSRYLAAVEAAKARVAKAESDLYLAEKQVKVLEAKAALAQNEANLLKAKQDVERLRPLAEQRAVAQQDLDAAIAAESVAIAGVEAAKAQLRNAELSSDALVRVASAEVLAAKAALHSAELDLSYTTIRAPIGGLIGQRNVDSGNLVGRGESTLLATIVDTDPIVAKFTVAEADYLRLRRGAGDSRQAETRRAALRFQLVLTDDSRYPEPGTIGRIESSVDVETSTLAVEANFPNPIGLLKPGQFGRVIVALEQRENAILIPQRSVKEIQGAQTVLIVDKDNKVAMRTITITDRVDDSFVVGSGIEAGELVIVEGVGKVRPGIVVAPVRESESRPRSE